MTKLWQQSILLLTLCFLTYVSSKQHVKCHDDESLALLQFKQSFSINESASVAPNAYAKVASWKQNESGNGTIGDCCSWDGVACSEVTGHVIGLDLSSSFLYGPINSSSSLFLLVHLQSLNLSDNYFIHSQIPSGIASLSQLTSLNLSSSGFIGQMPKEISQLTLLASLDLSENSVQLQSPIFEHLIQSLGLLEELLLSTVNISSPVPHSLANLISLRYLALGECGLSGEFPRGIFNLTELTYLDLGTNEFDGVIPNLFGKLTKLTYVDLSHNNLYGVVPSFSQLKHITLLDLYENNLSGIVEANVFLNLKKLEYLELSYNMITFIDSKNYTNATLPQFQILGLIECQLKEFPSFLHSQNELQFLGLSSNYIEGRIPEWFLNCSKETLEQIDLSKNLLTGFEKHPRELPWVSLHYLELSNNMLQGSLPIPPPNTIWYSVQENRLTGDIPPEICQVSSLRLLDLAHNFMTGIIPPCLGNNITSLSILMLKGNKYRGTIPNSFVKESKLEVIDISENQLEGQLPRSLSNCSMLQFVNFADNSLNDNFPFWLGVLSDLRILILRSNKFHGEINSGQFPKLRILDLSHNSFEGYLSQDYMIQSWPSMKNSDYNASYLRGFTNLQLQNLYTITKYFDFSMSITNRGVKREYEKVLNVFTVLDLSSNRLVGEISAAIGQLQGLQLLNLSNNHFTGYIPPSLANLTKLESLDLSQNSLSGGIPPQLAQLTSLAFLNVSKNNLIGPIPQGNQMSTFENTSYEGNLGLCGEPLSKKCGNPRVPQINAPRSEDDNETLFPTDAVDWIVVSLGLASGLIVGLVFGNYITDRHHHWFVKKFGLIRLLK